MRVLIIVVLGALAAGSFFAGRHLGTAHVTRADPASRSSAGGSAASPDPAAGPRDRPRAIDLLRFRRAIDQAMKGEPVEEFPLEETPEMTEARRAEMNEYLTRTLGAIPDEQRASLMDFNDRAIEFQRRQTGSFQRGTLTHEQYMTQLHEEMVMQLEELHAIVTDDQYRLLTGLEPGVDPYDYMITGQGGAPGTHVEDDHR